jgi:rod shape-determining protein MreD
MSWVAIIFLLLIVSILETGLGGLWLGGRLALDLSAAVVAYVALWKGPRGGAMAGFVAGILADLAQPQSLGRTALVLTLAGYVTGALGERVMRGSVVTQLGVVGFAVFARQAVVLVLSPSAGWRHGAAALALYALPAAVVTSLIVVGLFQLCSRLAGARSQ